MTSWSVQPRRAPVLADVERGGGGRAGGSRLGVMRGRLAVRSVRRASWSRAVEFARLAGTHVETWMFWAGWTGSVGCDECQTAGPKLARCWGVAGCHGYAQGCGCAECELRHDQAFAALGLPIDRGPWC